MKYRTIAPKVSPVVGRTTLNSSVAVLSVNETEQSLI
jgi:hypothetical protein